MKLSATLSAYMARHFLLTLGAVLLVFLSLTLIFDTIELLRRSASKPQVSLGLVLEMALLKLPYMGQKLLPFITLSAGMFSFWRLARHHELVIARSSGVSAWQFMLPVIGVAAVLGILQVTMINPLASIMLSRFTAIEAAYMKGQQSALALSSSGLWLNQSNADGRSILHAKRVFQEEKQVALADVTIFIFDRANAIAQRIDAGEAYLESGNWRLRRAWYNLPAQMPVFEIESSFPTDLTQDRIQDSFAPPETMSFWDLPSFIATLEESGFSGLAHRLYLHDLMATPLLLCAMVLIAATFTLRQSARRSGGTKVVVGGVLTGFLLYFLSDLVFALGLSERIPVILAAWSPSGVCILLGIAMLLHLEDG